MKTPTLRLLPLALLAAILSACSSGDGSDEARLPNADEQFADVGISFAGQIGEEQKVTRAETSLESSGHTNFHVWAYKNDGVNPSDENDYTSYQTVMNDYTVNWIDNSAYTTTSNTNGWEYVGQGTDQYIKFWDWGALAYRFCGVTSTLADNWSAVLNNTRHVLDLDMNLDLRSDEGVDHAPYYSRLWFSTGNAGDYPTRQFGQPVKMEFVKSYARVRFIFTIIDGLSVERPDLSSISFRPTPLDRAIAVGGTLSVEYPLTGTGTAESWTSSPDRYISSFAIDYYEEDDETIPFDLLPTTYPNSPHHWYYVLPRATQDSYTLSVIVKGGEAKTAVVPAQYMSWLPGYQYTYIFKITESGVTLDNIQVGLNVWMVRESTEHILYNW